MSTPVIVTGLVHGNQNMRMIKEIHLIDWNIIGRMIEGAMMVDHVHYNV